METLKKTKITPTQSQITNYKTNRNTRRRTPLRFGSIIITTDADLDG